ncbi:hypothetical protein FB565_005263 [Actinoplanes lutulentus]|uniref:PilZ domain-containing protein n=1 Tax=Actinoplanes lutulentus TaxID=1287878 RepID=A0A327ZI95_9ACTN|nr:hypothetical protein [Actinoplanes lutulentus]MBB2945530.1 hypothetical protein [Actinoplanes lutulentus]RAK40338.1 hypothetical protein B0I29_103371 [Actinoplanes lutulentus]
MTSDLFPAGFLAEGSRIEFDNGEERIPGIRVLRASDKAATLSMALDDVPPAGATVTLRGPAGPRGRYAVRCSVTSTDENRVELRPLGPPELEQLRHYVRGGGGESVVLVRPGEREAIGWVHDISESSIRAHFTDIDLRPGAEMTLRVQLAEDVVEFTAMATKVSAIRQRVPVRGPLIVELVAVFEQDERQAKMIRRYVLRQQVARARETA